MAQGLMQKLKQPHPPASPKAFRWPFPKGANGDTRRKFHASVTELMRERGIDFMQLARGVWGETDEGGVRNPGTARDWARGDGFPNPKTAGFVAQFFDVPLARLIAPKGEFQPMALLRPGRNGKANGHDVAAVAHEGNGTRKKYTKRAAEPLPARLPLPPDAPPLDLGLKTYTPDARFMAVSINGTVQVEVAMSLLALLHPEPR